MMNKKLFWILSFTWGLPLTLIGSITFLLLMAFGYKPKKWLYGYYIEIGEDWGGLEMGPFFLTDDCPTNHLRNHEIGHGIQNCFFGPLMIFIVCIPSMFRYWYRRLFYRWIPAMKPYDAIWFEGQATNLGTKLYNHINKK